MPHGDASLKRGGEHGFYLDTEWQADSFAGALLMPAQALAAMERDAQLTAWNIERRFDVSGQSARIRLSNYVRYRDDLLEATRD